MSCSRYPIYRIPTGPTLKDLDACFLTYHKLHTPLTGNHGTLSLFWSLSVAYTSLILVIARLNVSVHFELKSPFLSRLCHSVSCLSSLTKQNVIDLVSQNGAKCYLLNQDFITLISVSNEGSVRWYFTEYLQKQIILFLPTNVKDGHLLH